MYIAARKLFTSSIVHLKGDCGLATNTLDSDVLRIDAKAALLTQLLHLVDDLGIVPSPSGGVPGEAEQIFIKGNLLQVNGNDSIRQVAENG